MNAHEAEARSEAPGTPQVSVLMTVYNTVQYLPEAIESVIDQQTTRTWELLIVDDGSTDESLAIARRYAARCPTRMRVLQHPCGSNRGISASRNLALRHACGAHLAFLDSDDVWLPHHSDTLATVLDEHPEAAMVYAAAERWVDHASPFHEASARAADWGQNYLPPLLPGAQADGLVPQGALVDWFTADESLCPCICSLMVRAEAARAVGGFSNEFRGLYDDQAFHAKLSLRFPVYALDRCVARYRQHDRSCCARARTDDTTKQTEGRRFATFLASRRSAVWQDSNL